MLPSRRSAARATLIPSPVITLALSRWWALSRRTRLLVPLLALTLLALGGMAQPPKPAPPSRFSPNIVIIPIDGPIDAITSVSMRRRLAEAELSGADAIVIQIDSPGGELGAVIEITAALKKASISRTVAWVNPTAHSGAAITAIACQEIVVSGGASFGETGVSFTKDLLGRTNLTPMSDRERAKLIAPLLAEVVGSARRNGYDEKLMQGMVTLGVELWLVQNPATGERLYIDRAEYALLFSGDPPTSNPRLLGPPGSRKSSVPPQPPASSAIPANPTDLIPASPRISKDAAADASMALTVPSTRRILTPADKGKWTVVEYVSDGRSLFTFSDTDLRDLRIASARVNSLDELKQHLGATNVITLNPQWYEWLARLLQNQWIRGFLIITIILGIFIEMVHPGLILPGSAAVLGLLGLLLPEILMGLAGWWELVLIVGGVALIGVELFLLPGIGVAGAFGLLSLFTGLVLAFIPASAPSFPGMERSASGLLWGIGFVVVGVATAATLGFYMSKNMRTLPVLGRLILTDKPREEDLEGEPSYQAPAAVVPVTRGQEGVTLTTLRPSGKADFDGVVVDVVSDGPMIAAGARVRVTAADQFRVAVEPV